MIPRLNLTAWSAHAPWPELRQVEQDRSSHGPSWPFSPDVVLASELRFRGGTALNKLHFPARCDTPRTSTWCEQRTDQSDRSWNRLRAVLEPWLGPGAFDQSRVAPKLRFRTPSEEDPAVEIRLKIEINTSEIDAFDLPSRSPTRSTIHGSPAKRGSSHSRARK